LKELLTAAAAAKAVEGTSAQALPQSLMFQITNLGSKVVGPSSHNAVAAANKSKGQASKKPLIEEISSSLTPGDQ
jgi:hypothetical protein